MDEIISDKIINEEETNFIEKNITCETQKKSVLIAFLLITITLLIAVIIYCYLMKLQVKQKHLLPFHNTKLEEVDINKINWKWETKLKV